MTKTTAPITTAEFAWQTLKGVEPGARLAAGTRTSLGTTARTIAAIERSRGGNTIRFTDGTETWAGTATKFWVATAPAAAPKPARKAAPALDFASWTRAQLAEWVMESEAGRELAEIGGTKGMRKAELLELAERIAPQAAPAKVTPLAPKRAAKAAEKAKRAAADAPVVSGTPRDGSVSPAKFLSAAFPDGFTCRTCGDHHQLSAFPTVPAGIGVPRTERQSQCRTCRDVVNGHKEWVEVDHDA